MPENSYDIFISVCKRLILIVTLFPTRCKKMELVSVITRLVPGTLGKALVTLQLLPTLLLRK